jgi:hypothetical protein
MSLINLKNFISPLQNKVQIGGLLILALVVAVLRVVSSGEPAQPREALKVNDSIKAFLKSQEPETAANTRSKKQYSLEDEDPFRDLAEESDQARRPAPTEGSGDAGGGLSDVKRMVGLQ